MAERHEISTSKDSMADGHKLRRVAPRRRIEVWIRIARVTLREPLLRFSRHLVLLLLIALGIWLARLGLDTLPVSAAPAAELATEAPAFEAPAESPIGLADLSPYVGGSIVSGGISRAVELHTNFPNRPRLSIIKYMVQQGDTLFGIAEKFGLQPETVLWGNYAVLADDPHRLRPGQELNIPPIDGVLHSWSAGEGLNGVASFYGVSAQEVVDWPGNELDISLDPANPSIEPGTLLMIPGGRREVVTWSAPRIQRSNPAVASILGPGACGSVYDGPIGVGAFVWPTPSHYLSGYDYNPSIHPGIDLAGDTGHAIFASDNGVVVYSGWNDWGYGYVIVIDHGNGWQTLYAHLSQVNVGCGQAVFQGQVIGAMGSTGNSSGSHLHFEMMHDDYGKVNPWNFLP
jgi:murein DD-endopeptidase MepM/ murein hydrolase activator NlpD